MRNNILRIIAGVLLAGSSGYGVYNYTGNEIILPNGETMVTHDLPKSLTKVYKERDIKDSLTIVIHHTAGSKSQSLETIAKFHVEKRGWPEIAYHIAINESGDVFLLNNIEEKTYHNSADNTNTIGIVAVGNYQNYEPSQELINSIQAVTDALCLTLKIKGIKGHRDYKSTLCPGEYLYNELTEQNIIK